MNESIQRIEPIIAPAGASPSAESAIAAHACVVSGQDVYIGGIRAQDLDAGIEGQMTEVLAKIDQLLATAGSAKSEVVSVHIWLADMTLFKPMTRAWNEWVDTEVAPLRACVSGELCEPRALVELMVHARLRSV